MFGRFEKESFWIAKRVLLVSKRGPFEGQKDNYWKAKGVVFEFWILSFEFWIVLGYACDFELFNFWFRNFEFWIVLGYACDFELFNFEFWVFILVQRIQRFTIAISSVYDNVIIGLR